MIDQAARKQMADTIRSYLNEEIKSFQFSNALDDIRTQTADATVDLIADILWCFYDDDWLSHKVIASKEEWDYFHRLLLVLESDTELEGYRHAKVVTSATYRRLRRGGLADTRIVPGLPSSGRSAKE